MLVVKTETEVLRQKSNVKVFICIYADYISAQGPLDFEVANMGACRDRIVYNILREFGTQGEGGGRRGLG